MYPAIDQLVSHAGRLRNRTRGRLSCPIVLRAPYGGGIRAPEHHSESPEAFYAHIPGIRVVIPSSPRTAYGLLARGDPRPRPRRLPRAQADLSGAQGGGRRRWRGAAARPLLRRAGGPRPDARELGRPSQGDARGRRSPGGRGHRGGGDRRRDAEAARFRDPLGVGGADRPLRHRPRGAAYGRVRCRDRGPASPTRACSRCWHRSSGSRHPMCPCR